MENNQKIPVYVLSGFLGSGKTTILLNMLEDCKKKGLQPGIILNELGQINVESHLFEDKQVFELLNGCICCTIQDDLKGTMDELILEMERYRLDVLFIEGTGVANPMEIQEVLLSSPYINQFDLMSIITVLDASHYLEYQSVFSSSIEVRNLMREQMACGSLLLLNKIDLIPGKQLGKIKRKIMKLVGAEKKIVGSIYGKVASEMLFEKRILSGVIGKQCPDDTHYHHSTVQAIKLEDLPKMKQKTFEKWIKELPTNVLRSKGFIEIEGADQMYSFQYASRKTTFTPVSPTLDRKPVIILIGMGLIEDEIHKCYAQLIGKRV